MQNTQQAVFALAIADEMVCKRFKKSYGISTLSAYYDLIDQRTTAHLKPVTKARVLAKAGRQRRRMTLIIQNGELITRIPLNNPNIGMEVRAEIDFATWLNVMEMGADTAWRFRVKGKGRTDGQVDCCLTSAGKAPYAVATISRLILNAKPGQQTRTLDGNPLNLRRRNLYLLGSHKGNQKAAKTDTRAMAQERKALLQSLAGGNYGYEAEGAAQ